MLNAQLIRDKIQSSLNLKEPLKRLDDKASIDPNACRKSDVLMDTRAFNDTHLNTQKCLKIMTKVLYLLNAGEQFTPEETTPLFFGITKLFQSSSDRLRRMTYLLIKSLNVNQAEIFIVTSSLIKDMNNTQNDCYRANAIRVLSKIVDTSMASQIDRYLKSAILDRNQFVQSSALVCGINLINRAPEVIRKWTNEVTSAFSSKNPLVQFHALALLYCVKSTDMLALEKIITSSSDIVNGNPLAECLLIRFASSVLMDSMEENIATTNKRDLVQFLLSKFTDKNGNELVAYEALKRLCDLLIRESEIMDNKIDKTKTSDDCMGQTIPSVSDISSTSVAMKTTCLRCDVTPMIHHIHILLLSSKPVVRYAAVNLLYRLSPFRPHLVSLCNEYIESLLTDSNRGTATLALISLLKTGHESDIDKLLKQINGIMSELSDVSRIDIVRAIKQLCLTYPTKHKLLMGFLSSILREEDSFECKNEAVISLIYLTKTLPEAQEIGLLHLSEFIEDCEYPSLCTKILSFLGDQVPEIACPSNFIRFMYNRLILEAPVIRAAAIDALTKIANKCPSLREDISTLLELCTEDNDDEVRDRASAYCSALIAMRSSDDTESSDQKFPYSSISSDTPFKLAKELFNPVITISLEALNSLMEDRISNDKTDNFIDLSEISAIQSAFDAVNKLNSEKNVNINAVSSSNLSRNIKTPEAVIQSSPKENELDLLNAALHAIKNKIFVEKLGDFIHASKMIQLTESEAEYYVGLTKYMFLDHVILDLSVKNTFNDQKLVNVLVNITPVNNIVPGGGLKWEVAGCIGIDDLDHESQSHCYVLLKKLIKQNSVNFLTGLFTVCLKFTVKEDENSIGYDDEYPLEQVSIELADYMQPKSLRAGEFTALWDFLGIKGTEKKTQVALCFKSISAAVTGLIKCLNMFPCENSDKLESDKTFHHLLLSGTMHGIHDTLCRTKIVIDSKHGCIMQLLCRSISEDVCNCIITTFE